MQVNGPFYVKENEQFVLAECCKECAFGDEKGCLLNPCIHFQFEDEDNDSEE